VTPTYFESALRLLSKQYMDSKSENKYGILSLLGVLGHPKLVMFAKSIHIDAPKLSFSGCTHVVSVRESRFDQYMELL